MTPNELLTCKNKCQEMMLFMLNKIDQYFKAGQIPEGFLNDIEEYWNGFEYEVDSCINGQLNQ